MDRAVEDDRTAVAQMRRRRLNREEHGGDVGTQHLLERRQRGAADRRRARNAGIGEHNIEPAERFDGGGDGALGRGDIGRVGLDRQQIGAQFPGDRVEPCPIAAGDRDLRALGDEQARRGKTDAAVAAGDQRRLVREPHGTLLH